MIKRIFSNVVFAGLVSFIMLVCSTNVFAMGNIYYVDNERDLRTVISEAMDYDFVILGNDVYLQKDLEISTSLTLDLNGNTIYILKEDASIVLGKKIIMQIVEVPSHFIVDGYGNIIKVDTELSVGEIKQPDRISYNDNINITILNGNIIHCDGTRGADGKEDTWLDFDGKNGTTPSEPIKLLSGILNLYDMAIYGGAGGNGGNGTYQSLLHVPFGGGAGGNGGTGGNGGNVIRFLREECKVFINENTIIVPGKAGRGGKKGCVNPNWWLYRGLKGIEGKDGIGGQQIS